MKTRPQSTEPRPSLMARFCDIKPLLKHILFGVLCFLLGGLCVVLYPFKLSDSNITIEVAYIRYACGDCYVQYRVQKVAQSAEPMTDQRTFETEDLSPTRFLGWDVLAFYIGEEDALARYLDEHYDHNGQCSESRFRLQGQFKRRLVYTLLYHGDNYDGVYFDAHKAVALGDNSAACGHAQETPL